MISIIIPIYNAEKWLKECLESIALQSYKDFEVLMVDDGSMDGSKVICTAFAEKDRRFLYFYQVNAGVSVARNTGLLHAKGEWLSFVDSDDKIDKDFFAEMLDNVDGHDAVWCGFTFSEEGLGKRGNLSNISKEDLIKNIIYEKGKKPQLWSLLYRKSIIDKNSLQFTPGCIRNEDYEFFMKYFTVCEKPIARIGYAGYYYRQNPQSVMHQRRSQQSVLMSIQVASNVGAAVERMGIISDKNLLTSFTVVGFLYNMSRDKNLEVYDVLHTRYPIKKCLKDSIRSGGIRAKVAALTYSLLGRKVFYKIISSI